MSRISLARKIAQETGESVTKAARLVDEVGVERARRIVDDAESSTTWKLPATAGIGTGGVLYYREQGVRESEAAAQEADSKAAPYETLRSILQSDLSAEQKQRLLDATASNTGTDPFGGDNGGTDGGSSDESGGNWIVDVLLGDSDDFAQNVQRTLLILIVLGFVLFLVTNGTAASVAAGAVSGGGDS